MPAATFTAIIESDDDGYHAYVPALPGCHTWGKTIDEARANLVEAVELHIGSMRADGDDVPFEPDSLLVTKLTIPLAS